MKQTSTLFLKAVVLLMGVSVFALCTFLFSQLLTLDLGGYRPIVIGMLVAAIPFFVGWYQTLMLLSFIDANKAFSYASIKSLQTIKLCALVISIMYGIGMPYIYSVAQRDDAPGVVLLGLIFTFAPLIIAVFSAVLEKVFLNAVDLKSENELTV